MKSYLSEWKQIHHKAIDCFSHKNKVLFIKLKRSYPNVQIMHQNVMGLCWDRRVYQKKKKTPYEQKTFNI